MSIRWLGISAAAAALATGLGCDTEDPCQDYVSYVCDCHADDPEYDCEQIRTTYEGADADVQAECASALQDLEDADQAAGETCGT